MDLRPARLEPLLARLDTLLGAVTANLSAAGRATVERWRADAAALRFHLRPPTSGPLLVTVIGGTGTGKSTLVNRLLDRTVSAASFHRTFTSGPDAVTRHPAALPDGRPGNEHVPVAADQLPAPGRI